MPLAQVLHEPRQSTGAILRSELSLIGTDIFGHRPDPNRLVIEALRDFMATK